MRHTERKALIAASIMLAALAATLLVMSVPVHASHDDVPPHSEIPDSHLAGYTNKTLFPLDIYGGLHLAPHGSLDFPANLHMEVIKWPYYPGDINSTTPLTATVGITGYHTDTPGYVEVWHVTPDRPAHKIIHAQSWSKPLHEVDVTYVLKPDAGHDSHAVTLHVMHNAGDFNSTWSGWGIFRDHITPEQYGYRTAAYWGWSIPFDVMWDRNYTALQKDQHAFVNSLYAGWLNVTLAYDAELAEYAETYERLRGYDARLSEAERLIRLYSADLDLSLNGTTPYMQDMGINLTRTALPGAP